jgi:hypothetical protein
MLSCAWVFDPAPGAPAQKLYRTQHGKANRVFDPRQAGGMPFFKILFHFVSLDALLSEAH